MSALIAVIVGAAVGALILWVRSRDIKVAWYEWLIGAIGLVLALFGLQNFIGSQHEFDASAAAPLYLLVATLPGVILMAIAVILPYRRSKA